MKSIHPSDNKREFGIQYFKITESKKARPILENILKLATSFKLISCTKVPRTCVKEAHDLAKRLERDSGFLCLFPLKSKNNNKSDTLK